MISLPPDFPEEPEASGFTSEEIIYPEVTTATHKELFELADWMLHEAPWKEMTNRHSFLIVDPTTGEQRIAAVMGNGGDLFGFHLYLPDEGTRWFSNLMLNGQTSQSLHDAQFEQRMLEMSFDDGFDDIFDEYDEELDEAYAPSSWDNGVGPEKLDYAQFRSYLPGCPPWHLEQHEAELLLTSLRLFKHYYQTTFKHHSGLLFTPQIDPKSNQLQARIPICSLPDGADASDPTQWNFSVGSYTAPAAKEQPVAPLDEVFAQRMKTHRVSHGTTWEIGAIYLPSPVLENGKPHYSVLAIVGDRTNGMAHGVTHMLAGDCRFTLIRRCLEKAAGDCGLLPANIVVGSPVAETALADVAKSCGLRIMPAHDPSEMDLFHEITDSLLQSEMFGDNQGPDLTEITEEEHAELQKLIKNAPTPDSTPEEIMAFIEQAKSNPKTARIIEQFLGDLPGAQDLLDAPTSLGELPLYSPPESQRRYVFRVDISGAKPPIWRRITIPDDATFFDLHLAIQAAFGWSGYHLHSFEVGNRYPDTLTIIDWKGEDDEFMMFGSEKRREFNTRLKDIFGSLHKKARYTYDFGDSWEHTIKLEKEIEAPAPDPVAPFEVIKGRGASPLEDCGGIWGLQQIIDGTHPSLAELSPDRVKEIQNATFDIDEIYPRDPDEEMALMDEMNDY